MKVTPKLKPNTEEKKTVKPFAKLVVRGVHYELQLLCVYIVVRILNKLAARSKITLTFTLKELLKNQGKKRVLVF